MRNMPMAIVCLLLTGAATISRADVVMINGAGATFPYPIYSKWFSEFRKVDKDTQVNYNSIGSGGGIKQFLDNTVDFGASDAPMNEEQLAKSPTPILHIPTVLGAVVLSYNVPGAKSLRLTPELVAEIYMGKVTKWNDPKILKENPGFKSSLDITPVYRSDGSGTTNIFTDYLSKVSADWKKDMGQGTALKWKAGLGGKGNEGVTGLVKQNPGSIGYVELVYAVENKLEIAALKNKAGQFVTPSVSAVTAAAEGSAKDIPADFRVSITDAGGKKSYPISGFTYLLIHKKMKKEKGQKIVDFLNWMVGPGQKMAAPLSYASLPAPIAKRVKDIVKSIQLE